MTKKSFPGNENNLAKMISTTGEASETTKVKSGVGRKRKEGIQREGAGTGLPEEWIRYTLIMNKQTLEDVKDYAWFERITIKEAVDNILREHLDKADFERPKK